MTEQSIEALVCDALKAAATEGANQGTGKPFEVYKWMELDQRGRVGEHIVVALLRQLGRNVDYNEKVTDERKSWDFICDDMKYEVKTAGLSANGSTFQHEHISRLRQYDGIIFADIAPSNIYITCTARCDIKWADLHHRKEGAYYKWDTNLKETRKNPIAHNIIKTLADFEAVFTTMERRILSGQRSVRGL